MTQNSTNNSGQNLPSVSETNCLPASSGDIVRPEIPGYDIKELLGQGGMGLVWKASQHSPQRVVALKQMNTQALESATARARFRAEVEVAARLEHPNIARVYDCCMDQQPFYFTMELIKGQRLDEYVKRKQLSAKQIMALIHEICLAMAYAHEHSVIHRDLKPSNVLVTENGVPHIVDFGVAKRLDNEAPQLTVSDTSKGPGTLVYMSPEQVMGKPVNTCTDIYSVGVIAYRLLTGQFPYDLSGAEYECMQNITQQEPIALRRIVPTLDADLEAIVLAALEKSPSQRYAAFSDLAMDIKHWLNGRAISIKSNHALYRIKKTIAQHSYQVRVISLLLVIVAAFSIVVIEAYHSKPPTSRDKFQDETELSSAVIFTDFLHAWHQDRFDPTGSTVFLIEGSKERAALDFLYDPNEPEKKISSFQEKIKPHLKWFCDYICGEDYLKRKQTAKALESFQESFESLPSEAEMNAATVFYKRRIYLRIIELNGADPYSQNTRVSTPEAIRDL